MGGPGGGSGTQKSVYQKWPDKISPTINFRISVFPAMVTLVWRGGGGPGGVRPVLQWCTPILALAWRGDGMGVPSRSVLGTGDRESPGVIGDCPLRSSHHGAYKCSSSVLYPPDPGSTPVLAGGQARGGGVPRPITKQVRGVEGWGGKPAKCSTVRNGPKF